MNCPTCGTALSCGCQMRTASNGKQCCTSCIGRCQQVVPVNPPPQQPNQPVTYPPGPYRP